MNDFHRISSEWAIISSEMKMSTCVRLYFHHPFLHHKAWGSIQQIFWTITESEGQTRRLLQPPHSRQVKHAAVYTFISVIYVVYVLFYENYRSRKQLGFLVYSGAGEHSAAMRFSGRPHAELCSTAQIDHHWLHTNQLNYLSVLFSLLLLL